jgi:Mlc titration factor MtfA (ptsG expression regulator)
MLYNVVLIFSLLFVLLILLILFIYRRKPIKAFSLLHSDKMLLQQYVSFYNQLDDLKKSEFEDRITQFLSTVKISGINTNVDRLDQLLVASSAIIPIFGFANWQYMNLNEVLLYPGPFDEMYNQEGDDRTRAGVIGDGPLQNVMVISKHDLRLGFLDTDSTNNTGIHEFVHLIDKTDGAVDGIPEILLDKQYVLPWLSLMQTNIERIRNEQSDINSYGATNHAEFFAVASEYFFKQPGLLQQNHPELFELLSQIFRQKPVKH